MHVVQLIIHLISPARHNGTQQGPTNFRIPRIAQASGGKPRVCRCRCIHAGIRFRPRRKRRVRAGYLFVHLIHRDLIDGACVCNSVCCTYSIGDEMKGRKRETRWRVYISDQNFRSETKNYISLLKERGGAMAWWNWALFLRYRLPKQRSWIPYFGSPNWQCLHCDSMGRAIRLSI